MNRRTFLAATAAATLLPSVQANAQDSSAPVYKTGNARWQAAYDKALGVLAANVQVVPRYSKPVLIEGASYAGIWQECGPHEALVYRKFRPDVARNSHMCFFELQRADGQFPANNKAAETGFGQIQMVVPIAATAWELANATGDDELLNTAYTACSMWDAWLTKYRNTRGTGLTEGFCTYDTGHDNSPRWAGIDPQCPNKDAKNVPQNPGLPRLCPDLSATTFGARMALAQMASQLGKDMDADQWQSSAEDVRKAMLNRLYVAEEAAFYDLDANNRFVKVRSDILSRVCGEHVPDQALFDTLWSRQIHNPHAFWSAVPLPSVALDDPQFVRGTPANSWGGAAQALTALRAGRWFDHYGRSAEFSVMMNKWCEALQADMGFRQQLDPATGQFTPGDGGYSPAALVMMDYTWRLAGITEDEDGVQWNVRPDHPAAQGARFTTPTDAKQTADMVYDGKGATLTYGGNAIGRIDGTARLITDARGRGKALVGIAETPQKISVRLGGREARKLTLAPNQRIPL